MHTTYSTPNMDPHDDKVLNYILTEEFEGTTLSGFASEVSPPLTKEQKIAIEGLGGSVVSLSSSDRNTVLFTKDTIDELFASTEGFESHPRGGVVGILVMRTLQRHPQQGAIFVQSPGFESRVNETVNLLKETTDIVNARFGEQSAA